MTTVAGRAFLEEIRAQRRTALDELRQARAGGDDMAEAAATGRLCDLAELARRNDAPWLEPSPA
jgi:hypothetical protein